MCTALAFRVADGGAALAADFHIFSFAARPPGFPGAAFGAFDFHVLINLWLPFIYNINFE